MVESVVICFCTDSCLLIYCSSSFLSRYPLKKCHRFCWRKPQFLRKEATVSAQWRKLQFLLKEAMVSAEESHSFCWRKPWFLLKETMVSAEESHSFCWRKPQFLLKKATVSAEGSHSFCWRKRKECTHIYSSQNVKKHCEVQGIKRFSQVMYLIFIPLKVKRGCHTWITNTKYTCERPF